MHCLCVDPAHVHRVWPMVTQFIEDATRKGGGADFDVIQREVLAGEKYLWVAADEAAIWAAVVTGLHTQQGQKFCMVWVAGGKNRELWHAPMQAAIEQFAKDEGCYSIRLGGRKGWGRAFPDFKLISILLEKVL